MDTANYLNEVGSQVNNHTKYSIELDRLSIINVCLIKHLNDLLSEIENLDELTDDEKEEATDKINGYILCMKKELNFYADAVTVDNCILTETEDLIEQED